VQAEDDDGDIKEQVQVTRHLRFPEKQIATLRDNTRVRCINEPIGQAFIQELDKYCDDWLPDLIVINPLQSYLGGELFDDKILTPFLRTWLTPLLKRRQIAALIISHTTKKSSKEIAKMDDLQRMYAVAGSAQMANWPRAMLFLANTDVQGIFDLWAVKRWQKIGWSPGTKNITIAHSPNEGQTLWQRANLQQQYDSIPRGKLQAEDILFFIPYEPKTISFAMLYEALNKNREEVIGEGKIRLWLKILEENGKIKVIGKGPKRCYSQILALRN
jgi:hypothetical protein